MSTPLHIDLDQSDKLTLSGDFKFAGSVVENDTLYHVYATLDQGKTILINSLSAQSRDGVTFTSYFADGGGVTALADFAKGTSGNDTLRGGQGVDRLIGAGGDDTLDAGDGNDQIEAQQGRDTVLGGIGNDTIYITDSHNIGSIDGGADDVDTVVMVGKNAELDLTTIATANFTGVEVINISQTTGANNSIRLDSSDVNNALNQLRIDSDASGDVYLEGAWVAGSDVVIGSATYHQFSLDGKLVQINAAAVIHLNETYVAPTDDANVATSGADQFNLTKSFNTAVDGLGGDDTFAIAGERNIGTLNGGAGVDTLKILDITNLSSLAGKVTGIEVLDMSGTGHREIVDINTQFLAANGESVLKVVGGEATSIFDLISLETGFTTRSDIVDGGFTWHVAEAPNGQQIWLRGAGISFNGTAGADVLNFSTYTSTESVSFVGGAGNDVVTGGAAADTFNENISSTGNSEYFGGLGNDRFNIGTDSPGNDKYHGEGGTDTIALNNMAGNVTVTYSDSTTGVITGTGVGTDQFDGVEVVVVTGTGSNVFDASAVNTGGVIMNGGANDDRFISGGGQDTFRDVTGSDTYVFSLRANNGNGGNASALNTFDTFISGAFASNKDGILDSGEDKIDLSALFAPGAVNVSNVTQFLNFSGAVLQIDRDGSGSSFGFASLVQFTGNGFTNADLVNLLTSGQVVV